MSYALLDSFQLIVAGYLLYVAAKGSGQMYRFGNISEKKRPAVNRRLRKLYLSGGLTALLEFGVCFLQNSMFTLSYAEGTSVITQNYSIELLPFISYRMLSFVSTACSTVLAGLLIYTVLWLRSMEK